MHVRTWVLFCAAGLLRTARPPRRRSRERALYSDAEIVLLRSDGPYPAELELSPGFFRVPQKELREASEPA